MTEMKGDGGREGVKDDPKVSDLGSKPVLG